MEGWNSTNDSCLFRDITPCVTTKDFHSVIKHVNTLKLCQTLATCIFLLFCTFGEMPEPLWYYYNTVLY